MREHGVKAWVRYDVWISDHYPVCGQFFLPSNSFLIAMWPKPPKELTELTSHVEWECEANTYEEWSATAQKWLSKSYGIAIQPKGAFGVKPYTHRRPLGVLIRSTKPSCQHREHWHMFRP